MATSQEIKEVSDVLASLRSPCIVELGARVGEDEEWLRMACRESVHYVMVEPDVRNCQVILDKATDRTRRLIIGAVADHDGSIEFYGSVEDLNTRGSGSIRKPTNHIIIFPRVEFPRELHTFVPCYTLDTIFEREWLSKIDLLWVDVQGAERDMIAGGRKALSHTRFLFMETEDREVYEGMALKPELIAMLSGWTIIGDFGYNCFFRNDNFKEMQPR
jgi:FkbM family methyltransferase